MNEITMFMHNEDGVILNHQENYLVIRLGDIERYVKLTNEETLMLKDIFNRMVTPPTRVV